MKKRVFTLLYVLILLIDLIAIALEHRTVSYITEPLLIVMLAVFFLANTQKIRISFRILMMIALCFSLAGNVALFFEHMGEQYFIIGLAAYLVTHLAFILFFLAIRYDNFPLPNCKWPTIFLIEGALLLFIFSMLPYLGDMSLLVIVYAVFISFTLLTSIHAFRLREQSIGWRCIIGAVLFIISDSLLAIDHFYHSVPAADVMTMATYGMALWGLGTGGLRYLQMRRGVNAQTN